MKFEPYPWQSPAIDHAINFLSTADRGAKCLYAAPTGTGKSVIELVVQERMASLGAKPWIVTPKTEIIDGMLDKLGAPSDVNSLDYHIATPVTLRNRLLDGRLESPSSYIVDESHHHSADTYQQLDLLSGIAPAIGYTATPYRGSPKSTRQFREAWGDPIWLITYQEAVDEGFISLPRFEVLPLVDDDIVEVSGGDFDVTSIDGATVDRLGDLADHAQANWYDKTTLRWNKSTIFACPSTHCCVELQRELAARGLPAAIVSASAGSRGQRPEIFEATEQGFVALLHINVVTEGVDLKLRRLVDLAPTLSPVKWVQQLGRITRPWKEGQPEYICTNRNILRHAYALDGVVPISAIVETDKKFGPTQRAHSRVLGMEAIGRFKPTTTKLLNGCELYVYSLSAVAGRAIIEFCCLVRPVDEPIWATKINTVNDDGTKSWGKWIPCDAPNDVKGFSSISQKEPSEKQLKWWARSAHHLGLDSRETPNRKSFQALPVLADLAGHGVKL